MTPHRAPRVAPLYRLAVAQAVSMAGDRLHHLALVSLVSARTAAAGVSPEGWLFALGAAIFLPGLLLAPLLGPRLDALPPSRLMAAVDAVRAGLVFALPLLLLRAPLGAAVVALVAFFALNALFLPARGALPPQLVPRPELAAANALLVASAVVAALVATAFGGLLVEAAGWETALRIDAATYLVSALLLWSVTSAPVRRSAAATRRPSLHEGLAWMRNTPAARDACHHWCLLWALGGVLQVAGVTRLLGAAGGVGELGLFAALAAAGGLLGALWARRRWRHTARWVRAGCGLLLAGACAVLAGTAHGLAWAAALLALGGAAAVLATASETALHRATPEGLRATAFGMREAAGRAAFLAGGALAWGFGSSLGSPAALVAGTALALLYSGLTLLPRGAARTAWRWRPAPAPGDSVA